MNGLPEPNGSETTPISNDEPFFQRTDWFSFAITTVLVLIAYLLTLAPEVTLEFSGIFSAGAMYAGVPHPAGFPLWTLYAWLFSKLLPFSNIAWRVAFSSAVAGALACGVIALMVSRGGKLFIKRIPAFTRLTPKELNLICIVSGCVAGMGFAFDSAFWCNAVTVETWALSLLLFALALCFLMKWIYAPMGHCCLYAAALTYGLLLTDNQSLSVAAIGFQFLILFGNPALGREILLGTTLFLATILIARTCGRLPAFESISLSDSIWQVYLVLCLITGLVSAGLALKSRRILTEWRAALLTGFFLALGLSFYFYVPIASMTNPPMNWGYARTLDGFIHTISRGQYEGLHPTESFLDFAGQMKLYFSRVLADFGLMYLIPALIPWVIFWKMGQPERSWMLGLLAVYFCLSFFLVAMLNPPPDLQAQQLLKEYFAASHLILAIWSGYGLVLVGGWVGRLK